MISRMARGDSNRCQSPTAAAAAAAKGLIVMKCRGGSASLLFRLLVCACLCAAVCHGIPLSDQSQQQSAPALSPPLSLPQPATTIQPAAAAATIIPPLPLPSPTTTTTVASIILASTNIEPQPEQQQSQQPEAHPMDDIMPGTTQSPVLAPLAFIDVPQHTETELAASVLLACRTAEPVVECRWSWQPLPPTHLPLPNIDDSAQPAAAADSAAQNSTNSTAAASTTTTQASASLSLPVRTFTAFGNASNDCSVRFSSAKYEQMGYWSCAARRVHEDSFTSTQPAKLSIVHVDAASLITFAQQETSIETPAGVGTRLPCRTLSPVRECQWSWRQLNQSQPWDAEMRRFPATGNDSTNCDLGLPAVRQEHEGFWTCGVRIVSNSPFVQTLPLRLMISEVEFVQLSRGIQITAGETVFLRCLVNKPVYQCEWSWRPSNSSKNSTVVKKFSPNKETDHDCSVRFKNILYEEEGLWTCGVRLTHDGILHEAPSTTVTLLPSGRVNFTETPDNTSAAINTEATLRCSTNGRVERCSWAWRALNSSPDTEPTALHEFPSYGDLNRNCSLVLQRVSMEDQGFWSCRAYLAGLNADMIAAPAKLTVYEEEDVTFSELSQDIQISSGGTVSLRCVTSARVEQCRWSLTPEASANTTVVVKQFPPAGTEGRDCSVKLSHALQEQEGLWTCGARLHAKQNYTDAPPARLSLIEPEPITVTVWGVPHQMVNLACKTGVSLFKSECFWKHGTNLRFSEVTNSTKKTKHVVTMNHTTGVCSLQFTPDENDFGEWICEFIVDNEQIHAELGSASILLLNNSPDQQLGWLVGAITSTVLFLLIIVVVVVVYKTQLCARKMPAFLETLPPSESRKRNGVVNDDSDSRYMPGPAKIDLSYHNPNFLPSTESINNILPNRSPHLYERVGRRDVTKNYENVVVET